MYQNSTEFLKDKKLGKTYKLFGKINSINQGEHFYNIDLLLIENFCVNIKIEPKNQNPIKEKIYFFEVIYILKKDKNIFLCKTFDLIENVFDLKETYKIYSHFFPCTPISFDIINNTIEHYLSHMKNPILKQITMNLYYKNKNKFLISAAAFKMHHNYYGGLGHHTFTMLKLADIFLKTYTFFNKDLLYAGIILHDMAKIQEFDFTQKNYNKEGILLGHLILGANNIHEEAILLNVQNTEEIVLLKHLLISHHGLLEYGAAKKPQTSEALLLWFLDDMDAKFNSIGAMLEQTDKGTFTEPLAVVAKKCFYKPDF